MANAADKPMKKKKKRQVRAEVPVILRRDNLLQLHQAITTIKKLVSTVTGSRRINPNRVMKVL